MSKSNLKYDADVIREFAAGLYKRANSIVWTSTILFALVAASIGGITASQQFAFFSGMIMGTIGALVGASYGQGKAFQFKLQAQTALAQVQIEMNTRTTNS